MFKKTLLLSLLMATIMPWQVRAQETLTVFDGTDANQYIPMYGYYFDAYTKSECIIPASELTNMEGSTITAITFYAKTVASTNSTWGAANQKVFIKEVSSTNLSGSYSGMTDATVVFDGLLDMPTTSSDGYTITFSEDFTYTGGNLLIGVYNESKGKYNKVEWYGISGQTSGVSAYGNNSSSLESCTYNAQSFLPKTTFTYNPATGGSCTKPKNFNVTNITAHTATLNWTAGDDDQSNWDVYVTTTATDVPDEYTLPTYQVTECSKELNGLTAQTTYYVYVRAVCTDNDMSKWANKTFSTTREALAVDQSHSYSQDFEISDDWTFINGALVNIWCWGSATNNGGEKAMYVSDDDGVSNEYNLSNTAVVYATKLFAFAQGTYTFIFDWMANGESTYDYLRVALIPGDKEFEAGTSLPSGVGTTTLPTGWIALDGGSKLNQKTSWQTQTAEATISGTYTMVFIWRNDSGGGSQPPAAIDNISISFMNCPRPTSLTANNITGRTATLTWTENGNATDWVLQYATNNGFTENLTEVNVSGTASKDLANLLPETKYYARVKSVLGSDESSWSDIKDFTTLATCPKPTLSYVTSSNTAHTGSVSWTGSTADAYEVAYRPKNDFDPTDMTLTDVVRIQLEDVSNYTYTLEGLQAETKYYIYLQADCGDEDGKSSWSNRVTFTTLATCLAPSYLTDESVTSSSVDLSWTKGADDQDAWQFRYKKSNESEYTYVLVENNPENSYTLQGLEPATTYDVNVRAWCGGDDYSKWSLANQDLDKSITTACAELTLPYICDFEGAVETGGHFSTYSVPKCWDRVEMQYGSYSPYTYYPYVNNSNAHNGSKCLWMYRTPNSANQAIILPAIDDMYQMNDLQIRFWAKAGSSNNTLTVGVMENDNFVQVAEVEGISTTYAEYTVLLSNYNGNGRNIAIKCGSSSNYLYFYIDDVLVEEIPSCFIPTGLTNTAVDVNTASFIWQAGKDETEWNIQYKKASESEWGAPIHVTTLPTAENPYVLTGLKRGTEYEARIQAYCDADDQSEWSTMPVSFTTDCGIWTIDEANTLTEDFNESTFPPSCWNWIRVSNYYGWQHSSGQYNPLDQQGAAYSYWPSGDTYLILPKMHINGAAQLMFDMVFSGSGSGEESSVVLSTTGCTAMEFTKTLWTANEFPTTKTNVNIDLSAYNNQDVYIAFKYAGVGTSGRTWHVDNVLVYVGEAFTKDISAYTSGNDHYSLIASPIGEVSPENVLNMLNNNYDLYYFDQTKDLEWVNYKGDDGNFNLAPSKGYLYANSGNVTLKFVGTPYTGNAEITLTKAEGEFSGWNLIGNPFGSNMTLTKPFYRMNDEGSGLKAETETGLVNAMEGVFVLADNDGETVTFSNNGSTKGKSLALNVTKNRSDIIDRAIVRFDEGQQLPKFMLNPNKTKLYIPEHDLDYAIVRSNNQGELPVNFKAEKNGIYTIHVNATDVKMNYLHLIDNLTGADIDLLQTQSYSFDAKVTDYASRFKLIFKVNDDDDNSFAFYNNGNIIIDTDGNNTLQIVDMTGRIVLRKDDVRSIPTRNVASGIYMIQLIQNNEVRTQKILIP